MVGRWVRQTAAGGGRGQERGEDRRGEGTGGGRGQRGGGGDSCRKGGGVSDGAVTRRT